MQITGELLPKSFLCSCAAKVHQIRVEINHPPIARVHLSCAVLMAGVGRGRDRGLALALWVARWGLAAKGFFQCRSPAVSSQILFWVCFCRARVCCVPECLLLTNHWIYSVSTLWSAFFISWRIVLLCHASENEPPKYEISVELCFIGMTAGKCWSECCNPQCLCLRCTVKYAVLIVNVNEIKQAFNRLPHVFRIFYS